MGTRTAVHWRGQISWWLIGHQTRGRRIRKVRYEVPYDGRVIQVDLYRRKLNGLVTAEVEFPDEDAASRFHAPGWLGREVTGDEPYSNQSLARHGLPPGTKP